MRTVILSALVIVVLAGCSREEKQPPAVLTATNSIAPVTRPPTNEIQLGDAPRLPAP